MAAYNDLIKLMIAQFDLSPVAHVPSPNAIDHNRLIQALYVRLSSRALAAAAAVACHDAIYVSPPGGQPMAIYSKTSVKL